MSRHLCMQKDMFACRETSMYGDISYRETSTPNLTWGDIFECSFKAQSSKLERLFSLKRGERDVRALRFELSKMTPQVGLAVLPLFNLYIHQSQVLLCAVVL